MKKCCICGSEIVKEGGYVVFTSAKGEEMQGCEACERQMHILMKAENPEDVKDAVNYFYTCAEDVQSDEVRGFLRDIVESNAAAVDELKIEREKQKPVAQRKKDYFADRDAAAKISSPWISILRVFSVIYFVAVVATALLLFVPLMAEGDFFGIGMFLTICAVGLFALSFAMVTVNMARDIKIIRMKLEDRE